MPKTKGVKDYQTKTARVMNGKTNATIINGRRTDVVENRTASTQGREDSSDTQKETD